MDEYQFSPFSLSKELHLSHSIVRALVVGNLRISVPTALRLAKFFVQTPDYWLDLQREADLNEASKDEVLRGVLVSIPKAKKPAPTKEKVAEMPNKLSKKTTITTTPRTRKSPKKIVKKK